MRTTQASRTTTAKDRGPLSRRRWAVSTLLGWVAGWTLGWRLLALVPPVPGLEFVFWAVPGAVAGFVVGVAQWLVLRRVESGLWSWIPATTMTMAWGAGAGLVLLVLGMDAARSGGLASVGAVPLLVIAFAVAVIAGLPAGALAQWALLKNRFPVPRGALRLMVVGWTAGLLAIWVGFLWSAGLGQLLGAPNWAAFAALWAFSAVGGAAHAVGSADPVERAVNGWLAAMPSQTLRTLESIEKDSEEAFLAEFLAGNGRTHRP